jgi:hypothetical protein
MGISDERSNNVEIIDSTNNFTTTHPPSQPTSYHPRIQTHDRFDHQFDTHGSNNQNLNPNMNAASSFHDFNADRGTFANKVYSPYNAPNSYPGAQQSGFQSIYNNSYGNALTTTWDEIPREIAVHSTSTIDLVNDSNYDYHNSNNYAYDNQRGESYEHRMCLARIIQIYSVR